MNMLRRNGGTLALAGMLLLAFIMGGNQFPSHKATKAQAEPREVAQAIDFGHLPPDPSCREFYFGEQEPMNWVDRTSFALRCGMWEPINPTERSWASTMSLPQSSQDQYTVVLVQSLYDCDATQSRMEVRTALRSIVGELGLPTVEGIRVGAFWGLDPHGIDSPEFDPRIGTRGRIYGIGVKMPSVVYDHTQLSAISSAVSMALTDPTICP